MIDDEGTVNGLTSTDVEVVPGDYVANTTTESVTDESLSSEQPPLYTEFEATRVSEGKMTEATVKSLAKVLMSAMAFQMAPKHGPRTKNAPTTRCKRCSTLPTNCLTWWTLQAFKMLSG